MYHTLLVPLDGSAYSERALPMAMGLARHLKARVVLMRAAGALVLPGVDATEAQVLAVREARTYLEALASGMSGQGLNIETAVPFGDAAEEILVALEVVRRNPLPVMLIRPTQPPVEGG